MDPRRPSSVLERHISLTTPLNHTKDLLKGLLHTIFFHRYFTPLIPCTQEILDLTLPYITADSIDTLIENRIATVLRNLDTLPSTSPQTGQIKIEFLEKKRRKGWFVTKPDEETPWEIWIIDIFIVEGEGRRRGDVSRELARVCLEVMKIVNEERGHIPPITTNERNPFPYHVMVGKGKGVGEGGWSGKMGIF